MFRILKKILTFGMANVDRVGFIRNRSVRVYLPYWDRPKRAAVEKILRKFFGKQEADYIVNEIRHGSLTVLSDQEQSQEIEKSLKKLFKTDESSIHYDGPYYFDGHEYMFIQDYCNNCGHEGFVYKHSHKGHICDACGSSDVVVLSDMKPKEVEKHVRKKQAA